MMKSVSWNLRHTTAARSLVFVIFALLLSMQGDSAPARRDVVLGGVTHRLNIEAPEEYNKTVLDFLPE